MRILLILISLIISRIVLAEPCIDDDFSTDPSLNGWTEIDPSNQLSWDSINGEIDFTWVVGDAVSLLIHNTARSSIDQWAQIQLVSGPAEIRAVFRNQDSSSENDRYFAFTTYGTYDGNSYDYYAVCTSGTCQRVDGARCWMCVPDVNWYAFTVEGTGTSTVFKTWACGASPCGPDETDPSTWGAPDHSLTSSGSTPFVDSGSYIGYQVTAPPTSSPGYSITAFKGGSIGCTTGGGGSPPTPPSRRNIIFSRLGFINYYKDYIMSLNK